MILIATGIVSQDNSYQYTKYPPCEQKFSSLQKFSSPIPEPVKISPALQMHRIEEKLDNAMKITTKIVELLKKKENETSLSV